MAELTFVQFLVALFMSLGALCVFIWAVLSGLFTNVEDAITTSPVKRALEDAGSKAASTA